MPIRLIDTHAHVSFKDYAEVDISHVLERAQAAGVVHIINIGAGEGMVGNDRAQALAERYPDYVSFTVGVHPHDAQEMTESDFSQLTTRLRHPNLVAIGEVGLDYYYEHSPRERQVAVFDRFIELAREMSLPLVVHDRGAENGCYERLKAVGKGEVSAVIHCFTGTLDLAKRYLDLGCDLSFTGIITFKKAEEVREVVRAVPLDRLLVETDSPYLAPIPYRGKRNEPAHVLEVAKKIAEIKGVSLEAVAEATTENARRLFKILK